MTTSGRSRAAVITISDSTFHKTRQDVSGPAVASRLEQAGFSVPVRLVVPDEGSAIIEVVCDLADQGAVDVIVTTGGTGVAPRDVTPEALRTVLETEMPGLRELMRMEGLKKTPMAALSRSLAGVRGRVLIAALPGSPKGAVESLSAILNLMPHILDLIDGNSSHAVNSQETDGNPNASK